MKKNRTDQQPVIGVLQNESLGTPPSPSLNIAAGCVRPDANTAFELSYFRLNGPTLLPAR
ncbi:hypothetical protein L3476_29340 [Paenibacillus thiaminolyticus]|uniref:hypothetical protein n=1 Tax=Paenibacillus thiaminolyticus TaxID=49283 RepID=UPI0023504C1B|nr:hypothetical protein [Paenibacillus thiaminolyticus]WCR27217.1 hypothetical protein L3476_29340 [Paenibacillus thiaminolyticus]